MSMLSRSIQPGYDLIYHHSEDSDLIELLLTAYRESIVCIQDVWGLPAPSRCPVYLMTSWISFIFHSAPWYQKILYGYSLPFYWHDISKSWRFAGGWAVNYLDYPAVGIKSPRLMEKADRRIGQYIFKNEPDITMRMRNILCHELTHAFAFKCRLPMWLSEGLAMLTAEKYLGCQTVHPSTLHAILKRAGKVSPVTYFQLKDELDADKAYHYARGYWITRYLHETDPDLLPTLFAQSSSRETYATRIAATFDMSEKQFWVDIDMKVAEYFAELLGIEKDGS